MQQQLFNKLFGSGSSGGVLDQLLGGFGFGGGGTVQPGFPDTGTGPGFNIPGMPGYGDGGSFPPVGGPSSTPPGDPSLGMPITSHGMQPGFREDMPGQPGFADPSMSQPGFADVQPGDPTLGMPITAHAGGGISAVPGMQPYGQGRRNQLSEDFNNLAKAAQTQLIQRGFGGSSLVGDQFSEIAKQKSLSMNELNDQLFREQLQFRAAERAPMFSILQSLLGGIF
jgi:hypothetical protein